MNPAGRAAAGRPRRPLRSEAPPAPPPLSRRALSTALGLALAGLALATFLVYEHASAHAGHTSFCAIDDVVNCDRVATSRWSVVLGLPVAVWGVFGYALLAGLAGWGLAGRKLHPRWPSGLLCAFAGLAMVASLALAAVSELAIGALCLLCAGSWLVSALLLVAAWRLTRPEGVTVALAADLVALRSRPGRTFTVLAAGLAAIALTEALYPRYWDRSPAVVRAPAPMPSGAMPAGAPPSGVLTVVEFSDYECPYCAKAHEANKQLFGGRTDVVLARRQYPLDPTCNPAVKRAVHLTACQLARAAICARAQGKFDAMDDALFANQRAQAPVQELARKVGLDLTTFDLCLDAPETTRLLEREVSEGTRAGVNATPTYVVNGATYSGELPAGVLPPRPGLR